MTVAGRSDAEIYQSNLESFLAATTERFRIPGIGVEVRVRGARLSACAGTVSVEGDRPMVSSSRFRLGHVTRLLTAALLRRSLDAQKMGVDAPIAECLPELKGSPAGDRVTIAHLLSNTAGFQNLSAAEADVRRPYSWGQLVDFLRASPLLFEPGSAFSFSYGLSAIASEVLRRVADAEPAVLARRLVFDCLEQEPGSVSTETDDVTSHLWHTGQRRVVALPELQMSQFWSACLPNFRFTLGEIASCLECMLSESSAGARVFSSEMRLWLKEQAVVLPAMLRGPRSEPLPLSVGGGFARYFDEWIGCNGPLIGQSLALRAHRSEPVSIVIGVNIHNPQVCDYVFEQIVRSLSGTPPARSAPESERFAAEELVGEYDGTDQAVVSISARGPELVCSYAASMSDLRQEIRLKSVDGHWQLATDPGVMSVGFFRHPGLSTPGLMLGSTACRKRN